MISGNRPLSKINQSKIMAFNSIEMEMIYTNSLVGFLDFLTEKKGELVLYKNRMGDIPDITWQLNLFYDITASARGEWLIYE